MSNRPHLSEWESTWAFVAGGGIILMILALGLNAMRGGDTSGTIGLIMLLGLILLVSGTGGWLVQYQPWKKFDDLTTPLYTGHEGHDHAADAAHAEPHVEAHDAPHATIIYNPLHDEPVYEPPLAPPVIMDPMSTFPPETSTPLHEPGLPPGVIIDPMSAFPPDTLPEPIPAPPPAAASTPAPDDLKIISGIGPKIVAALNTAGVFTFADLIARTPEDLEGIVRTAQVRMIGHASTWVEQAKQLEAAKAK